MKNLLPNISNRKGFTLIELLVVIAIIAIISVVAIALFGNVQKDARDAKRKAELESIANVLELNKGTGGYIAPLANMFGGTVFPGSDATGPAKDPQGFAYCIAAPLVVTDAVALNFNPPITCTGTGGTAGYTTIAGTAFSGTPSTYKICTLLENRGTAVVYCRVNVQ